MLRWMRRPIPAPLARSANRPRALMPVNILMPALSPTMEKGNLAKWLKKEGDKVKPGDVIAEIETDKATMEYEAVDEGTLAKIVVPEGTPDVPVKTLIAVLAEEGEDVKAAAAAAGKGAAAKPAPPKAASTAPSAPAGAPAAVRATPRLKRLGPPVRRPPHRSSLLRGENARRSPAPIASSPLPSRVDWPERRESTSPVFRVQARTGGSLRATSRRQSRAAGSWLPQR